MKTVTILLICILFITCQIFIINIIQANEWGLERPPLESDKCDSVILHYDGKTWIRYPFI